MNCEPEILETGLIGIDRLVDDIVRIGSRNDRLVLETATVLHHGLDLEKPVKIEDLFALEKAILGGSMSMPKTALDDLTRHDFSDGIYIRTLIIPGGMFLTGAIHKLAHMSVLAGGDISILTVDGVKRMKGSAVIQTRAGIKRVGYAHQYTVWMDILPNPTNERDVEKLWDMFYHNQKPE